MKQEIIDSWDSKYSAEIFDRRYITIRTYVSVYMIMYCTLSNVCIRDYVCIYVRTNVCEPDHDHVVAYTYVHMQLMPTDKCMYVRMYVRTYVCT